MNNCNCNRCKRTCDCGPQKPDRNPCGGGCGSCGPAPYGCTFDLQVSPYDPSTWIFDFCGCLYKIKAPSINETCTKLYTNYSNSTLIYDGECEKSIIDGCSLGNIIEFGCLRDVEFNDLQSCEFPVWDPGCADCGDGCKAIEAKWRNYRIPDAGDCVIPLDEDGYYKVLVKNECGCIEECRLPAKPEDEDKIVYYRDSSPEDPDYPFYYGIYNETINLYLEQNFPKWFGKYDLEVTINYDVQIITSFNCENTNYRSLVVPVVEGENGDALYDSSILQGQATFETKEGTRRGSPWGTVTRRSSITFVVPKGKEAYLHHEFRLRTGPSFPTWVENALDGQRIPDSVVQEPNQILWTGSRLHALQAIVKPTSGEVDKNPVRDPVRDQLDHWSDWYPI